MSASSPPYAYSPGGQGSPPAASPSSSSIPANKRRIPLPAGSAGGGKKSKKNASGTMAPSGPSRKSSIVSMSSLKSSNHPLRQTSFPPDERDKNGRRSPSVSSTGFTRGNSVDRMLVPPSQAVKGEDEEGGEDGDGEEDDDYEPGMAGVNGAGSGGNRDESRERERVSLLKEQFTPLQTDRHDVWHRTYLNKPSVKKIANQVLAQSVTPSVATALAGFSKVFAEEVIERAKLVQKAWGDDGEGMPILPDHLREAARQLRIEAGKGEGDPVAGMQGMGRTRIVGGMGGRLFK